MARTHHADAAVSTSDLELVKGIGPKVAAVLHDAGINGLAELVASTPEELARNLAEHQVRVPAEKIVTDDWLGQARTLLHDSAAGGAATNFSAGTKGAVDQPWQELAGFSEHLDDEYYAVLSNGSWRESKVSEGGTASARVSEQLGRAHAILEGVTP